LTTRNPPANYSRWCCDTLKKEPSYKIPIKHRVFGIRAEESARRKKYKQVEFFEKQNHFHYHPILHWNEGEIWDYIEDNNLAYPELYDQGLSRIGCVICPFHSTGGGVGHNFYRQRWPKVFDRFEKKCGEWFEKRQRQGRRMFFSTSAEFVKNWYKGNVQWYFRK
jgi:phosphoadenosine phosphosulfate reductase